jgi:hypothetical protein
MFTTSIIGADLTIEQGRPKKKALDYRRQSSYYLVRTGNTTRGRLEVITQPTPWPPHGAASITLI